LAVAPSERFTKVHILHSFMIGQAIKTGEEVAIKLVSTDGGGEYE
jgi:hypothetical protein